MAEKTHGVQVEVEQTKKAKAVQSLYRATYLTEAPTAVAHRCHRFKAVTWQRALATATLQLLPGERLFALELAE
jgi:hypothetical protein